MNLITGPVVYGLGATLLASLAFGGWQWSRAHSERTAHAETKAEHANILREIADQTAAAARLAAIARDTFNDRVMAGLVQHAKEVDSAFERGRKHGADIAAGTQRVRTVWRDRQCPKAASGEGAGSVAGTSDIAPGRAEAIGRVLGLGGSLDADYNLAFERLKAAQGLLNACYDEPATPETGHPAR